MESLKATRQWRLMLVWFCIVSQLTFPVNGARSTQRKHNQLLMSSSSSSLKLITQNDHVVMDNGLLKVTLTTPGGLVTGIEYNGINNLLDFHQKEERRGYWDIVWDRPGITVGNFERIPGTSFKIIAQGQEKLELSFRKDYNPSSDKGSALPLTIDKRFVMLRGQSGFYSYAILERLEGWPELGINELRLAFKLQENFNYVAVSDIMQRLMPTLSDRARGRILDYQEAVLLTNPKDPRFKGEVDDKYQYSKDSKDIHLHGWTCPKPQIGFWMIIPSSESHSGGPLKQELTSHVGPTTLAMFHSHHYAGETSTGLKFQNGEPWRKVFGPVFVYLNSGSDNQALWIDAKTQMETETRKWPYDFPASEDFPHADQRGSVSGRLLINDKYINQNMFPAKSAYIGLAPLGEAGSWQLDAKGYQFWTQTDDNGYFTIKGVREGNYNLFSWVPGILGDYRYPVEIDIKPGSEYSLGNLVFSPPRSGPTLWEIGIPDRTAAEFYVPDPLPGLGNRLNMDRWRQYGLWNRYTDLYPDQDLLYRVGASHYSRDWFYAHVNRRISNNTYVPTTWRISFDLRDVIPWRTYTLRFALASANYAHLQIRINRPDSSRPQFNAIGIGRDNAIARHGIHGLYSPFSFDIPGYMLLRGTNTISLKQAQGGGPFNGLMYDYLRLEGPE